MNISQNTLNQIQQFLKKEDFNLHSVSTQSKVTTHTIIEIMCSFYESHKNLKNTLEEALKNQNLELIAFKMHNLRPFVSLMGNASMAARMEEVEKSIASDGNEKVIEEQTRRILKELEHWIHLSQNIHAIVGSAT